MNAATILHIHRISIFALCKCANCDVRQPTNPRIFSEDIRNGRVFVFAYKIQCFPYPENIVAYCIENYYFAIQESLTSRRRRRKEKQIFSVACADCVSTMLMWCSANDRQYCASAPASIISQQRQRTHSEVDYFVVHSATNFAKSQQNISYKQLAI